MWKYFGNEKTSEWENDEILKLENKKREKENDKFEKWENDENREWVKRIYKIPKIEWIKFEKRK